MTAFCFPRGQRPRDLGDGIWRPLEGRGRAGQVVCGEPWEEKVCVSREGLAIDFDGCVNGRSGSEIKIINRGLDDGED